jgi:peptidyl-prolyl cis-trans isomerase A (cyclophilin A)
MTLRTRVAACIAIGALTAACASASASPRGHLVHIRIATSQGNIDADLDSARAPGSVANFLRYVDAGLYRGGTFYRTVRADNQPRDSVKIAVIQGGRRTDRTVPSFPPIPLERTNVTDIHHRDGTLSMARGGPDSATDAFFICVGDQPALDFGGHRNLDGQGFAAFGHVTAGMDVVRRINAMPANAQQLKPPVQILNITRVR